MSGVRPLSLAFFLTSVSTWSGEDGNDVAADDAIGGEGSARATPDESDD